MVEPLKITIKWKKQNTPMTALIKQTIINKKSVNPLLSSGLILFKLTNIDRPYIRRLAKNSVKYLIINNYNITYSFFFLYNC